MVPVPGVGQVGQNTWGVEEEEEEQEEEEEEGIDSSGEEQEEMLTEKKDKSTEGKYFKIIMSF